MSDSHCSKPLCIRNITKTQQSRDYRFTVEWHTSAGVIKTDGWRWIVMHNRIVPPTANGHHIFRLCPTVRKQIRNLLTRIMAERDVVVPSIGQRGKK